MATLMQLVANMTLTAALLGQAPAAASYKLAEVTVSGARRYSVADVVKVSGLSLGQALTVSDLAAVADRLSGTGLFKTVRYRYVTMADRMTVGFEVEESDWTVPVVFDNFVWFTDEELTAAVRGEVPTFDGTAPPSDGIIGLITTPLTALLQSRQLPGRVRYTPDADLSGHLLRHLFSVEDPGPRTCAVTIDGASAVPARELLDSAPGLAGSDYSRVRVASLVQGTLTDAYRRRGYWRATFGAPALRLDAGCRGVSLTLPVSEGAVYVFDRAEWAGHEALTAAALDKLLGLKRGDTAGLLSLEDGLRDIGNAYGKQGYLQHDAKYTIVSDEASRTVVAKVAIVEGPQFHMGTIEFVGFSPNVAADLRKKWRLKPGDVYDSQYAGRFNLDEAGPMLRSGAASTRLPTIETRLDPVTRVVDLRLVLQ